MSQKIYYPLLDIKKTKKKESVMENKLEQQYNSSKIQQETTLIHCKQNLHANCQAQQLIIEQFNILNQKLQSSIELQNKAIKMLEQDINKFKYNISKEFQELQRQVNNQFCFLQRFQLFDDKIESLSAQINSSNYDVYQLRQDIKQDLKETQIDIKNIQFNTSQPQIQFQKVVECHQVLNPQRQEQLDKNSSQNNQIDLQQQEFQNIEETDQLNDIIYKCSKCQMSIMSENNIALPCYHSYHDSCFQELILQQTNNNQLPYCNSCNQNINLNVLKNISNSEELIDKQLKIQMEGLLKNVVRYTKCNSCQFIWKSLEQGEVEQCSQCQNE